MTALELSPVELPAVQRALRSIVEAHDVEATNREQRRGRDVHVLELREESALLESVLERLAGDQSPAPSRADVRAFLTPLDDEALHDVIGHAEELLDARFLESQRDTSHARNVAARYTSARRQP